MLELILFVPEKYYFPQRWRFLFSWSWLYFVMQVALDFDLSSINRKPKLEGNYSIVIAYRLQSCQLSSNCLYDLFLRCAGSTGQILSDTTKVNLLSQRRHLQREILQPSHKTGPRTSSTRWAKSLTIFSAYPSNWLSQGKNWWTRKDIEPK